MALEEHKAKKKNKNLWQDEEETKARTYILHLLTVIV